MGLTCGSSRGSHFFCHDTEAARTSESVAGKSVQPTRASIEAARAEEALSLVSESPLETSGAVYFWTQRLGLSGYLRRGRHSPIRRLSILPHRPVFQAVMRLPLIGICSAPFPANAEVKSERAMRGGGSAFSWQLLFSRRPPAGVSTGIRRTGNSANREGKRQCKRG